jgi:hypothetical protein
MCNVIHGDLAKNLSGLDISQGTVGQGTGNPPAGPLTLTEARETG